MGVELLAGYTKGVSMAITTAKKGRGGLVYWPCLKASPPSGLFVLLKIGETFHF